MIAPAVSLRHSCLYRVHDPATGADATHDCRPVRAHAGDHQAVQEALRVLYAPDPAEDTAATHEEWSRIDFSTLRFHRHGTTSFILVGDSVSLVQGRRRPLALKCILFPFLRVSTIVGATRDYPVPVRGARHGPAPPGPCVGQQRALDPDGLRAGSDPGGVPARPTRRGRAAGRPPRGAGAAAVPQE